MLHPLGSDAEGKPQGYTYMTFMNSDFEKLIAPLFTNNFE